MTRIFTEGFESGDLLFFTSHASVLSTSVVRSGTRSLQNANIGNLNSKNIPSVSLAYFRFAFNRVSTFSFRWYNGATELGSIRHNTTSNRIEIYTSTGTLVATGTKEILANTWYLIEVYVNIADAGTITVRVDGIQDATYSGDTKPGTAVTMDSVRYYLNGYLDDLAMNDTSGFEDNSWCGDGRVIALTPDGNGSLSQLTGSDGNSTDNYLLVNEVPSNGDTSYVQGSTAELADLYTVAGSGLVGATIHRVWVESRSRDTVATGGLISLIVKTNGTEYDGATKTLGTAYAVITGDDLRLNPNTGVAWTIAELDALEIGVKTKS